MPKPEDLHLINHILNVFNSRIDKTDTCWNWTGSLHHNGYGALTLYRRRFFAHRISWEFMRGRIPSGMLVLHVCDNRKCVNPEHLFLGDYEDNIRDMYSKGRACIGEDKTNSKLRERDIVLIRRLYGDDVYTVRQLSEIFEVSKTLIIMIIKRKVWNHVST